MKSGHITKIKVWGPVLLWMGFIFTASSIHGNDIACLFPYQDVIFHGLAYAVLGFLSCRAFRRTAAGWNPQRIFWSAVILSFAYGLSDEFHQLFVVNRCASLLDLGIDGAGGLIGAGIYFLLTKISWQL